MDTEWGAEGSSLRVGGAGMVVGEFVTCCHVLSPLGNYFYFSTRGAESGNRRTDGSGSAFIASGELFFWGGGPESLGEDFGVAGDEEIFLDPAVAIFAEAFSEGGILGESFYGFGKFGVVGDVHDEPIGIVGDGFSSAGKIVGDDGEAMGEGFGNYVGEAVAIAVGIHDAGVPEDVGPAIFRLDFVGRLGAAELDVLGEAGAIDLLLQILAQGAVADDARLKGNVPGFEQGARGDLVGVAFLGDEPADGEKMERALGDFVSRVGRQLVKAAARKNNFICGGGAALAQVGNSGRGRGMNETGGMKFGFEEGVAPVTVDVIGVAAEASKSTA